MAYFSQAFVMNSATYQHSTRNELALSKYSKFMVFYSVSNVITQNGHYTTPFNHICIFHETLNTTLKKIKN